VQLPPAKSRSFASLRMTILYDDKQTEHYRKLAPLPQIEKCFRIAITVG